MILEFSLNCLSSGAILSWEQLRRALQHYRQLNTKQHWMP
jgi:hypothetical protein